MSGLIKPNDKHIVDFFDEGHLYVNRGTRERYLSVTTMLHQYETDFDNEYWSMYKAVEELLGGKLTRKWMVFKAVLKEDGPEYLWNFIKSNPHFTYSTAINLQNKYKEAWKLKNEKALAKGSKFHQKMEDKSRVNKYKWMQGYNRPVANLPNSLFKGEKRPRLCEDLPDGYYSELMLHNHNAKLAGQTDSCYIETINGVRYIDIDDYKTNEKLSFKNIFSRFKSPLNHLEECNGILYMLQISTYAWMAEQYGFKPRMLSITHISRAYREYRTYYMKSEIEKLIAIRLKQLDENEY